MQRPRYILPVIVLAQFAGGSLWFAGNAVMPGLIRDVGLAPEAVSQVTSAVQLGFIIGTLLFAFTALSDRVPARLLFMGCAILGGCANGVIPLLGTGLYSLLLLRFATGFFLAGIYPIGMKIAASWFEKGLGLALGYLVGALVLGTAFPHALSVLGKQLDWKWVLWALSFLAVMGGVGLAWWVPEGPFGKAGARFEPSVLGRMFQDKEFRAASFGYFGHMWELYAFWTFVPWLFQRYLLGKLPLSLSTGAFVIIGIGAVGCAVGGHLSQRFGSAWIARICLLFSGIGCLLSPFLAFLPPWLALGFLLIWGFAVVGDSPQFSALAAATAPPEYVGSALTIMNCIGFAITIFTIEWLGWLLQGNYAQWAFLCLLPGPLFGLWSLRVLSPRKS